ncbi:MAG: hypothetical protein RL088_478 [Verrucomicrobiota bacterium]|jgi:arylsulfatase A
MKFLAILFIALSFVSGAAGKPNIVVIMADDLGWRDLHCYGNAQVDTPPLDKLAPEDMRFTGWIGGVEVFNRALSAEQLAAIRSAILTGRMRPNPRMEHRVLTTT